jgi:hypothetical protein
MVSPFQGSDSILDISQGAALSFPILPLGAPVSGVERDDGQTCHFCRRMPRLSSAIVSVRISPRM